MATESQRGSYTLKKIVTNQNSNSSSPQQSPIKTNQNSTAPIISDYPNTITNGTSNNGESRKFKFFISLFLFRVFFS